MVSEKKSDIVELFKNEPRHLALIGDKNKPLNDITACGESVSMMFCWRMSDKERVTCPACLKAMKGGEDGE